MKTKQLIIALAVIALAGGFAVRATREADRTKAAIRALASQRAGVRATIATVEQRLRTANEALAQLAQKTGRQPGESGAGVGANAAASGNEKTAKTATPARRLSVRTIIANDPQKMAEYAQNYRASLDLTWGGMFKTLGLSAEQIEKWKNLKVWFDEQQMDLDAAIETQGLDRNSTARQTLERDWQKTRMTKEAELLGDLVAPYYEYLGTQVVRAFAQKLAGTAVYSSEPVTLAQVERTTQVLAANSQRPQVDGYPRWVNPNTVNWDAASAQLQGVLSPSQIATLGNFIQRDVIGAKVSEQWRRLTAQFKAMPPSK